MRTSGPDKTLLETVEKEIIKDRSKYECLYTSSTTSTQCLVWLHDVITHVQVTWKYRSTYARILQHIYDVCDTSSNIILIFRHPSSVYLHSLHCCLKFLVVKLAAPGTSRAFYIHSVQVRNMFCWHWQLYKNMLLNLVHLETLLQVLLSNEEWGYVKGRILQTCRLLIKPISISLPAAVWISICFGTDLIKDYI